MHCHCGSELPKKTPALKMVSSLSSWWAKGQRGKVCMPVRIFQWSSFSSCLYSCLYKSLMIVSLACVWILYLKVSSRIFMYRMYFAKNLRCLVRILKNACILQILISRAEVRIQNILDSDSNFYF